MHISCKNCKVPLDNCYFEGKEIIFIEKNFEDESVLSCQGGGMDRSFRLSQHPLDRLQLKETPGNQGERASQSKA